MTKQEKCSKPISINKLKKSIKDLADDKELKKKLYEAKEWYTIRAILGNT